ncbi:FHA domain-containing protein [Streptomyces sp. NPDC003362]
MQIRLTVVDPLGPPSAEARGRAASRDLLVTAPAGTALSAVASALASAVTGDGAAQPGPVVLYAGAERLDDRRCTLGEPPLVDGAVLSLGAPADPEPHPEVGDAPARLDVVAGPDAGGVHLLHGGRIDIGRSADADVPLDDPDVSRLHCAVTLDADGRVTVADLGSTNGTTLDGSRVGSHPVRLAPGALLRLGESALRLAPAGGLGARRATAPDGEGFVRVSPAPADGTADGRQPGRDTAHAMRPPVVPGQAGAPRIEDRGTGIEDRGTGGRSPGARLVPPAQPPSDGGTHGGRQGMTGGLHGTPADPTVPDPARPGTAHTPAAPRRRGGLGAWARRLAGGRGEQPAPGPQTYDAETAAVAAPALSAGPRLPETWPDPAALLLTALGPGPRLWERGPGHPEALTVRLGTADRTAPDGSGLLPAVPVTADLREVGALGLAGPRPRLSGLARAVLAQLAALHSPATLEIVLISTDRSRSIADRTTEWSWLGWLPQVRPGHGQDCRLLLAYDREQAAARTDELLRRLDDHLTDRTSGPRTTAQPAPAAQPTGPTTTTAADMTPSGAAGRDTAGGTGSGAGAYGRLGGGGSSAAAQGRPGDSGSGPAAQGWSGDSGSGPAAQGRPGYTGASAAAQDRPGDAGPGPAAHGSHGNAGSSTAAYGQPGGTGSGASAQGRPGCTGASAAAQGRQGGVGFDPAAQGGPGDAGSGATAYGQRPGGTGSGPAAHSRPGGAGSGASPQGRPGDSGSAPAAQGRRGDAGSGPATHGRHGDAGSGPAGHGSHGNAGPDASAHGRPGGTGSSPAAQNRPADSGSAPATQGRYGDAGSGTTAHSRPGYPGTSAAAQGQQGATASAPVTHGRPGNTGSGPAAHGSYGNAGPDATAHGRPGGAAQGRPGGTASDPAAQARTSAPGTGPGADFRSAAPAHGTAPQPATGPTGITTGTGGPGAGYGAQPTPAGSGSHPGSGTAAGNATEPAAAHSGTPASPAPGTGTDSAPGADRRPPATPGSTPPHRPSWALQDDPEPGFPGPYTVVVVDGDPGGAGLRDAIARLAGEGPRAGIHVVCLAETDPASPASPVTDTYEAACAVAPTFRECGAVALLSGDVATALRLLRVAPAERTAARGPVGHGTIATVDAVSPAWAERFARALAPLRPDGSGVGAERQARVSAPLPQSARLLDELGLARATPASLMARWADAADDTRSLGGRAWAVLGAGPRGPVVADLVADGPHLLVEGPAGSGRTELLRAVVASLASAERPDRLGIVLMDGRDSAGAGAGHGDGLRVCTDVPHVTTHLTANDPVRMREFAQSLSAELKRRAELLGRSDFAEWHTGRELSDRMVTQRSAPGQAATGDLETPPSSTLRLRPGGARRPAEAAPPPLPRLVVVVDDLDALFQPALGSPGRPAAGSVVRALEAVAREGERLGVHLVAAAGPGGRTAESEAARRARLRIVLEAPAAGPDEPAPGRGALTGPNGRVTPFQGGRVTGRIPRTATLRPTVVPLEWHRMGDPPARRPVRELGNGPTDLALLASALERAAREVSASRAPSLL